MYVVFAIVTAGKPDFPKPFLIRKLQRELDTVSLIHPSAPVRLAHLSDLHGTLYGRGQARLLEAVDRQAARLGLVQDILLEVNIAREASKGGCLPEDLLELARRAGALAHVRVRGVMSIPPAAAGPGGNRGYFARTRQLFVDIRKEMGDNNPDINCLSMGMSGDYEDAVREGATLVRVGAALFGPRPPVQP